MKREKKRIHLLGPRTGLFDGTPHGLKNFLKLLKLHLAVGSRWGEPKTEILDIGSNKWSTYDDYPFQNSMFMFSVLYINNGFILFGGCLDVGQAVRNHFT